jgi:hypothetical protein
MSSVKITAEIPDVHGKGTQCSKRVKVIRPGDTLHPGCVVVSVGEGSLTAEVTRRGETFGWERPEDGWHLVRRVELYSDVPGFTGWKIPDHHKHGRRFPPRREYKLANMAPGWEVKFRDGERMVPGEVWSDGPDNRSWWVVSEGRTVLVRESCGELRMTGDSSWWVTMIRNAEAVRRDGVFAVVESVIPAKPASYYSKAQPATSRIIWHRDPQCPDAAGRERFSGSGESDGYFRDWRGDPWGSGSIARVIVGLERPSRSPQPFCARCVFGDPGRAAVGSVGAA